MGQRAAAVGAVALALGTIGCSGALEDAAGPAGADPDPAAVRLAFVRAPSQLRVAGDHVYVFGMGNRLYRIPRAGGVPEPLDQPMHAWPVASGVWTWEGGSTRRVRFHPATPGSAPLETTGWMSHVGVVDDLACIAWPAPGSSELDPLASVRVEVRKGSDPSRAVDLGVVPALSWLEALPDGTCVARTSMGDLLHLGSGGNRTIAAPATEAPIALAGRDGPTAIWRAGETELELVLDPEPAFRSLPARVSPPFRVMQRLDGWEYGMTSIEYEHHNLKDADKTTDAWDTVWRARVADGTTEVLVQHTVPAKTTFHDDVRAVAFGEIAVHDGWVYFTTLEGYVARKPLPADAAAEAPG
jgi:hypothetical protein